MELTKAVDLPLDAHDAWRCHDHGADYVWRPCELADPPFALGVRQCHTERRRHQHFYVCPSRCAVCPVPAQLDALERARIHCGWLLSEFQEGGKPADLVESTQVVYDACKAALEQGEEHHG